jgi:hypothetical protein
MSSDNEMRLIDANEMSRHLKTLIAEYNSMGDVDSNINAALAQFAIDMLENAPTVNDCPNCEYKKEADYIRSQSSYDELIALRKFKEEHERAGKWVVDEESDDVICPFCNERHCCVMNYCGNCGAKLEKGKE